MFLSAPVGTPWMWCITSDCDSLSSKKETKIVSLELPRPLLAKRGSTSPCIPSASGEGKNSGLQHPQTFAGLSIAGRRDEFFMP
jgi:hypothetical protein